MQRTQGGRIAAFARIGIMNRDSLLREERMLLRNHLPP
jgi:hypothetical protein